MENTLTKRIVTNNKPRNLLFWWELPLHLQKEVDKPEEEDDSLRYFVYKGVVFDLHDFSVFMGDGSNGWDGHCHMTVWDAVLVKLVGTERVIVASAYW